MSTRCNIKVVDGKDVQWFYRHSDGYPEGTMPILKVFMNWLETGKIRNNLSQSVGWLIVLGAIEYNSIPKFELEKDCQFKSYGDIDSIQVPEDWKVGSIEITTGQHGDIEYLYTIDLPSKTLVVKEI